MEEASVSRERRDVAGMESWECPPGAHRQRQLGGFLQQERATWRHRKTEGGAHGNTRGWGKQCRPPSPAFAPAAAAAPAPVPAA